MSIACDDKVKTCVNTFDVICSPGNTNTKTCLCVHYKLRYRVIIAFRK